MKKNIFMFMLLTTLANINAEADQSRIELPELHTWKQVQRKNTLEIIEKGEKKHLKITKLNSRVVSLVHLFKPPQKIEPGTTVEMSFEAKGIDIIEVRLGGGVSGKYQTLFSSNIKVDSPEKWQTFTVKTELKAEDLQAIALNSRGKVGSECMIRNVQLSITGDN